MRRIPIQIAMSPYGDGIETVALCNDGTLWQLTGHSQWVEMPPIPQDESHDPLAKLYAKHVDLRDDYAKAEAKLHRLGDLACTLTAHTGNDGWQKAHRKIGAAVAEIIGINTD